MARATKTPVDPDGAPLKRLGGGRWQTRDERFTIEPQSGTWVIVDSEQADDFGMALVRGPFPSLTAAKAAIATARASGPAESPLAERIEQRRREPGPVASPKPGPAQTRRAGRGASPRAPEDEPRATDAEPPTKTGTAPVRALPPKGAAVPARAGGRSGAAARPDEASEPAWITDLAPGERGRARRLIAHLRDAGISDAEGLVRRDLVGGVPSLAALAISRRLERLGSEVRPGAVADLLADGRDEALGVRWRLVDGDGRAILLDPSARRRR